MAPKYGQRLQLLFDIKSKLRLKTNSNVKF
jgi:hypothetical protein